MKQRVAPRILKKNRRTLTICWILFVGLLLWGVLLEPWMGFQFGLPGVLVVVVGMVLLAVAIALLLYGRRRASDRPSKTRDSEHHQA
jgi:hypothetical protein